MMKTKCWNKSASTYAMTKHAFLQNNWSKSFKNRAWQKLVKAKIHNQQQTLVKIPSGIPVTRQETCYSSIVGCFQLSLEYLWQHWNRYSIWYFFQTLLCCHTYSWWYFLQTLLCCHRYSRWYFFSNTGNLLQQHRVTQKSLEKISSGISVTRQETCYSSIVGCFQKSLEKIPSGISVTTHETCYSSIVGCF
jgi:hypothetical protein